MGEERHCLWYTYLYLQNSGYIEWINPFAFFASKSNSHAPYFHVAHSNHRSFGTRPQVRFVFSLDTSSVVSWRSHWWCVVLVVGILLVDFSFLAGVKNFAHLMFNFCVTNHD